ncbi:MAG TPA: AraC family transcriptional regulator [Gemmatimonadales bacterium]|nr:AraC family transcriptional regulator [Gemmatimonadales bacterium]
MANLEGRSVRRSLAWDGLRAFEAVYQPHTALAMHEHSAPFFTYVLRGEFVERTGRMDRDCARGSVIFHPPCDAHANAVGPRGTMSLNVEISPELWAELAGVSGQVLSGDVEWLAAAVWREFHRDDAAAELGMDEAVALLCASVRDDRKSPGSVPARRLALSAEYISQHLAPAPRLAEVAHVAGVHPMHLARLFRQRYGYSMGEFVRRRRIAWACGQLASSESSLAAIGLAAGFADQAHFSRTFRRVTGCTPRWYRRHLGDASGVQDRGRLGSEVF